MPTSPSDGSTAHLERLRRLALRYEALAQSTGSLIWVIDTQLRPTGRNESWERYTGQSLDAYGQLGWLAAIHPDDRDRVRAEAARAMAADEPIALEVRIRRADGIYRRNAIHAVPVRDGGAVVEWIGTAVDVEGARQAADALAAVEERLGQAHAAAGVGTWEWNLETNQISWSAEIFRMLQADPTEPASEVLWHQRIHPDDRAGARGRWEAALDAGATHFSDTFRLLLPDGTIRWILSSAVIFRGAAGQPARAVGLDMDMTVQRVLQQQTEDALAEARDVRARLLALTDGAESLLATRDEGVARAGVIELARRVLPADAHAIWWLDPVSSLWRVVHAAGMNAAFTSQAVPGRPLEFTQPRGVQDVFADEALEMRRSAYAAEGIASLLTVPVPIHGERRAALVTYYRTAHTATETELRVGMALGQIAAAALGNAETNAAQDRAQAEAERQARRMAYLARASALLDTLDYETTLRQIAQMAVPDIADWCAVDIVQPDGRVARIVVAHSDPEKVQLAKTFVAKYPDDPLAPAGVPAVLRTGQAEFFPHIPDELLMRSAIDDEHLRMLRDLGIRSSLIAPLVARGRTHGAITFVSSATDRPLSEEDVTVLMEVASRAALAIDNARLYQEAELANRAKDDFLALLSHELRTPLNAIMGWSYMLRQGLPIEMHDHAIEVINRNAQSQKQLVEDLLDVARIAGGRIDLQRSRLDLRDVGRTAVDSALPAARSKGLDIAFEPCTEAAAVEADPNRLQQAAANLLSNAIKFTDPGGRIVVRVAAAAGIGAELSVCDTGSGIRPEFLPYIFDRFRQADTSLTHSQSGLGLGLWVVKQIVDAHGGNVRAESEGPGTGTTMTLVLPLID